MGAKLLALVRHKGPISLNAGFGRCTDVRRRCRLAKLRASQRSASKAHRIEEKRGRRAFRKEGKDGLASRRDLSLASRCVGDISSDGVEDAARTAQLCHCSSGGRADATDCKNRGMPASEVSLMSSRLRRRRASPARPLRYRVARGSASRSITSALRRRGGPYLVRLSILLRFGNEKKSDECPSKSQRK